MLQDKKGVANLVSQTIGININQDSKNCTPAIRHFLGYHLSKLGFAFINIYCVLPSSAPPKKYKLGLLAQSKGRRGWKDLGVPNAHWALTEH